jgi:hypothetical protein
MKTLEECEKQISVGKKHGIVGAVQIGQALTQINKDNLWVVSGAQTFEKYVEGEHGFSRATAYNLMGVASQFGQRILEGDVCDVTRLIKLLPLTTDANREELFEMACHVPSSSAFEANVRNLKGKIAPDDPHEHEWEPIPYQQCKICGQRRRVNEKN